MSVVQHWTTHRDANIRVNVQVDSRSAKSVMGSFRRLPDGWHYGEGKGATNGAYLAALQVNALFCSTNVRVIEAFPELDGGIMVCGRYKEEDLEVFCSSDGVQLSVCHERDDKPIYQQDDLTVADVRRYIARLPWALKSYDSCIHSTIVGTSNDFKALHSETQVMAAEFRSFAPAAHARPTARNAVTYSPAIIPSRQEYLQFSGGSILRIYPTLQCWNPHLQFVTQTAI